MLREYGTQRPSVFEILNHVHTLRGTQSRYTYSIPPKQPPMSPRAIVGSPLQPISSNIAVPGATPINPVDDLVMFKSRSSPLSTSPSKNAGVQAREKVLEAIAPMRRGRPLPPMNIVPSPSTSPSKDRDRGNQAFGMEMKFGAADDQVWNGVRGHKSGMATIGGGNTVNLNAGGGDPWSLGSKSTSRVSDKQQRSSDKYGFENDFSNSVTQGFGDAFEPPKRSLPPSASPRTQPIQISRPTPSPVRSDSSAKRRTQPRDAFEGLGLTPSLTPQTLGDARRTRTAAIGSNLTAGGSQNQHTGQSLGVGLGSSNTTYRPPSTHIQSLSPMPQSHSRPHSPVVQPSVFRGPLPSRPGELSAEERFPSLEDLDRTFPSSSPGKRSSVSMLHAATQPPSTERLTEKMSTSSARPPSRGNGGARSGNLLAVSYRTGEQQLARQNSLSSTRFDGTRSQHVTGTAMREARLGHGRHPTSSAGSNIETNDNSRPPPLLSRHNRPVQPRRHRSSLSVRAIASPTEADKFNLLTQSSLTPPTLPPRPSPQPEQRDWLTGASDDGVPNQASQAVLRESPSKRASYIERSPLQLENPLEAVSVDTRYIVDPANEPPIQRRETERTGLVGAEHVRNVVGERLQQQQGQTGRGDRTDRYATEKARDDNQSIQARMDDWREGRRSPTKTTKAFITRNGTDTFGPVRGGLKLPGMDTEPKVSSSPNGLTDNWSPVSPPLREFSKDTLSSSGEEGPEDLGGYKPGSGDDRTAENEEKNAKAITGESGKPRSRRSGNKGRQSSVHDLADMWGGSQPPKSPSKVPEKRRSTIVTSSTVKSPPVKDKVRSSSPQPLLDISTPAVSHPSTPSRQPNRSPSRQPSRKHTTPSESAARLNATPSNIVGLPSAPATPSRTRPQSMFLNPVSRSTPLEAHVSSSSSSAQQSTPTQSSDTKQRRSGRRTSISDMVHRYESFNGNVKPGSGPPPPIAPKPSMLAKTVSDSSSAGLPSPSAAATRFPKLSPPSSPVLSKASLAGSDANKSGVDDSSRHRRTPSPGVAAYAPRTAPSPFRPSGNLTGNHSTAFGNSPPQANKQPETVVSRPSEQTTGAGPWREDNATSEQVGQPAPERPYGGVSKLISQWQRAVDSNEPAPPTRSSAAVSKRGVANSSLRGR